MRPEADSYAFGGEPGSKEKHCAAGWSSLYLFVAHDRGERRILPGKIWLPDRAGMLGGSLFGECSPPSRGYRDPGGWEKSILKSSMCKLQHLFRREYIRTASGRCHAQGTFSETVCCWVCRSSWGSVECWRCCLSTRRQGAAATALMAPCGEFLSGAGCVPFSQIFAWK